MAISDCYWSTMADLTCFQQLTQTSNFEPFGFGHLRSFLTLRLVVDFQLCIHTSAANWLLRTYIILQVDYVHKSHIIPIRIILH